MINIKTIGKPATRNAVEKLGKRMSLTYPLSNRLIVDKYDHYGANSGHCWSQNSALRLDSSTFSFLVRLSHESSEYE